MATDEEGNGVLRSFDVVPLIWAGISVNFITNIHICNIDISKVKT